MENTDLVLAFQGTEDADEEVLDQLTRRLQNELRDLDIENIERLQEEEIPEGAKGSGEIAVLLVTTGLLALPELLRYIDSWMKRQPIQINITLQVDNLAKHLTLEQIAAFQPRFTFINTEGGAYVGGNVKAGGDFTGRDSINK